MKYLEETLKKQLKDYRDYETSVECKWGGKKRLFKCVDVQLEIKFCKAEMLFKDSLVDGSVREKMQMVEMMYRAYTALIQKAEDNGYRELKANYKCFKYKNNKIAIVCNFENELPQLKQLYGKDKDVVLFSIEELFRFINPEYLEAKEQFKQKNIDITFAKVSYA